MLHCHQVSQPGVKVKKQNKNDTNCLASLYMLSIDILTVDLKENNLWLSSNAHIHNYQQQDILLL